MIISIQQCNVCGAKNSAQDAQWAQIAIVKRGNLALPMLNRGTLDFCPACQSKTSIADALHFLIPAPTSRASGGLTTKSPPLVTAPGETHKPS